MRIVHFGAGNIGRGAIPEIFYGIYSHITFIDQNKELVDRINNTKSYRIINSKEIVISNYNAIIISDIDEMLLEIQKADLITTSCGINNLEKIADILNRIHNLKTKPIIIAFENNIRPSSYLKSFVENTNDFIFLDCTIDRIVPKQTIDNNTLDVTTESYLSVVIEKGDISNLNWFKNCTLVNNLDNYINLKLYGVNGLHFVIAILAHNIGIKYIHLAFESKTIQNYINIYVKYLTIFLIEKFKFEKIYITNYLEENLKRFSNPNLNDECVRIARNAKLKLEANNRVAPIFSFCFESDKSTKNEKEQMYNILVELISYKNNDDSDSIEMQKMLDEFGINESIMLLTKISI